MNETLQEMAAGTTRAKILVVDDEPLNIQVVSNVLGGEFEIYVATNGQLALDIARRETLDLILLDVMMPEMDGYEACKQLKLDPRLKEIPVIFLTALSQEEDEARGLGLGAVDYITKPFSPAIVQLRVHNHLQLKWQRDALEKRTQELEAALANVRTLKKFLPICAACKKVRDDRGYWEEVEEYIRKNTDTQFSHGICPECCLELYGMLPE